MYLKRIKELCNVYYEGLHYGSTKYRSCSCDATEVVNLLSSPLLSLTGSYCTIRSCSTNLGNSRLNRVHSTLSSFCCNCIVRLETTRFVLPLESENNKQWRHLISRQLTNRGHSRLIGSTSTVWRHCLLQNPNKGQCKSSYIPQYPVLGIGRITLYFLADLFNRTSSRLI